MRLLLDTNRYTDLDRGIGDVLRSVSLASEVYLPFITLAELHAGFRNGSRRVENEGRLTRFSAEPGVGVLFADEGTVDQYAYLKLQLRRQGTPIPDHDIWIAALALQHRLTLYDRDAHFDRLPQLHRF